MVLFKQVTIVGLGLIGGSLGMVLRRRRAAVRVVGLSRRRATLRRARQRGAIDEGTTNAQAAVRHADLVILATPVDAIVPTARRLARFCRPGTVFTDVGSTKAAVVRALERSLPAHVTFIGGHPVAGSEQSGIEAADPQLFDGCLAILTPTARTARAAVRRVTQLWTAVRARVVRMSPRQHDRALAATSHLPHLVAACLLRTVDARGLSSTPRSLLDMTRIAKSDPHLWDDIVMTNRAQLLTVMEQFARHWRTLRRDLARGDRRALRQFLAQAKARRERLPE